MRSTWDLSVGTLPREAQKQTIECWLMVGCEGFVPSFPSGVLFCRRPFHVCRNKAKDMGNEPTSTACTSTSTPWRIHPATRKSRRIQTGRWADEIMPVLELSADRKWRAVMEPPANEAAAFRCMRTCQSELATTSDLSGRLAETRSMRNWRVWPFCGCCRFGRSKRCQ